MLSKTVCILFFVSVLTGCLADNRGCPHPDEAKQLIYQQRVNEQSPDSGRVVTEIEIPADALRNREVSCITLVAQGPETTPDVFSGGKNRLGGYSIKLHSRERSPLDVSLFIYAP